MLTRDLASATSGAAAATAILNARNVYNRLLESPENPQARLESRLFLQQQLAWTCQRPHDFPTEPTRLTHWMEQNTLKVGERYADYLDRRGQGAPRQYFSTRSQALSFFQQVAPTKLVDGSWLYGSLQHWKDIRFSGLILTYLEELGEGDPTLNHVRLYRRLLAKNGCDTLPEFSDEHYVRGAIQLALAYNADQFLPELVGYNLGYEQLPLHLLITAFELAELNIDPFYFTLHITVDNASTGHARKAVEAVQACMPIVDDKKNFWRRVSNGYRLNDLGLSADAIVQSFDLEDELLRMLERKRIYGQNIHSDFCTIGGLTVNEWLSAPGRAQMFLKTLEEKRWIIRNEDPQKSRFWRLIDGPQAPMTGVFDGYEKQLLHDWISAQNVTRQAPPKRRNFRRYRKRSTTNYRVSSDRTDSSGDVNQEVRCVQRELLRLSHEQRMQRLIHYMSPSKHTSPAGLFATREFVCAFSGEV